jgi:arginine decarboxylase
LRDPAKRAVFFLLDAEIPVGPGGKTVPLHTLSVEDMPLTEWLELHFPGVPKIVLRPPRGRALPGPLPPGFFVEDAAPFHPANPDPAKIRAIYRALWQPRFWNALQDYVSGEPADAWHTPGHNAGNAFKRSPFLRNLWQSYSPMSFRSDLSVSVDHLGDLSTPEAHTPLADAQRMTADIFGAAQSRYITNGTSTSNKAMLMTLLRPGETVLVDRNCHKSVHHAVVTSGAIPVYLPAHFNLRLGLWAPVSLAELRRAVNAPRPAGQKPRMLVLTTATYEGVLYPVWEIGRLCEAAGILFYAHEAWAPYLHFHPFYTARHAPARYNAACALGGAHFAAQSTPNALAAFSQASMIHVSHRFNDVLERGGPQWEWLQKRFGLHGVGSREKFNHDLDEILRYHHSTSPNYPMMATLDCAGIHMRLDGLRLIEDRLRWIQTFKQRVARLRGLAVSDCFVGLPAIVGPGNAARYTRDGYLHDPMKMLVSMRNANACDEFKTLLRNRRIQWEKSTPVTVQFLVGTGTFEDHFEDLFETFKRGRDLIGPPESDAFKGSHFANALGGQPVVVPRDAALCDGDIVPREKSRGRVCAQLVVPYPPGIPVFLPGLEITSQMIALVKRVIETEGVDAVHGLFIQNGKPCVEVLRDDEIPRVHWLAERK